MMKKAIRIIIFAAVFCAAGITSAYAEGLKMFKLNNGLSVYVWEDPTKPDVYGEVVVRAGSFDEPEQYTGLAHYLEHVMFKGTQKIGCLDWEAERPIYEKIIAKYDEMAETSDQAAKDAISQEINALTLEAAGYSVLNEYSNIIETIGGTGLNAFTSYDMTAYHNSFPPEQIGTWMQVASERFINPVFRAFQSELETVYEEYNMYNDSPDSQLSHFVLSKMFEGTPYERDVIGLGEHLKNPRLSKLIEFYNDWYVAPNMALILVGNVDAKAIIRIANATFGRLPMRATPEKRTVTDTQIKGRKSYTTKVSQYPSIMMCYPGVPSGHPDAEALDICLGLLSNDTETGLLDQLTTDGELMMGVAGLQSLRGAGRCLVQAVPFYDNAQNSFESLKKVEKKLLTAISKISSGDIDEWVFESLKNNTCRDYDLIMEDNDSRASLIRDIYINEKDLASNIDYKGRIRAVTLDDVKRVAAKYLGNDCLVFYNEMGKPEKNEKIKKPEYDPIKPVKGQASAYSTWVKSMNPMSHEEKFIDWNKVQERKINDYSRLYYSKADQNDVFNLVLKYGAGSDKFPLLEYAASMMDEAGIMAGPSAHELKQELARMGVTLSISADRSYMYVTMRGYESSLKDACVLLIKTLMMPEVTDTQLRNIKGSLLSSRMIRKGNVNSVTSAMREYLFYGENSAFRKEVSDKDILNMSTSELASSVSQAAGYAAEIFYTGLLPFDEVYDILSNNLPLVQGEHPSTSPVIRSMRELTENTVFFIPNTDAQQSQIYFYIPGLDYDKADNVACDAFNSYFGGGFNGLVMQEVREYNSMAYTAVGQMSSPRLPGSKTYFIGYVGTQNDKAIDAIELYLSLLNDMPEHPENIQNIKKYLHQVAFTSHPDTRSLPAYIADCTRKGYDADPAITEIPEIDALTFDDVKAFYEKYVKGRPIGIGIVGNPKTLDVQALSKFGKLVRLKDSQLYNEEDTLF